MHLYNCIWVVLLISRLNLAFLSPKLSRVIDKVLVYLYPCWFNNPRNTLRWKLLQLTFVRLWIILFGLRTASKLSGAIAGDIYARLVYFYLNPSLIPKKIKISCNRIDMVCTPIYSFSAPEGKYLERATSLHPIEPKAYEIHLDFISLVK
jgi:hypothetical protein